MRLLWIVLLCVILPWSSVAALAATTPLESPKSLLVLYPDRPDLPAQLLLDQRRRSTLTAKITDRTAFYAGFMDVSRFPGGEYLQALHAFYLSDWRQLQRWGISEGWLPPGSIIRYQGLSMWAQYRGYIIGSVLLCLVEALLIVALLLQRRQRKQLDRWLAERLRFEMLSTDLSSSFINLSPDDDLGKPILHGLQRVTEFLGGDRGDLSEFLKAADVFRVRYSWAVEGWGPLPTVSPVGQCPWCLEQL